MKQEVSPKMTVLHGPSSSVGLRSVVTFLAAFFIVVSSASLLFERGQEEAHAAVQMALEVEHRNQEMHVAVSSAAPASEHRDQQETQLVTAAVSSVAPASSEYQADDQQLMMGRQEAEVQLKVKVMESLQESENQQPRPENEAAAEEVQRQRRPAELEDAAVTAGKEEECDWSRGRWVYDNVSRPLYSGLNCSFIFPEVACDKYGRKDVMYQHWRWQPHGCDLPRFNATKLLEKLRNKRLVYVGDSLNRNQWVSLVCMVEASIPDDSLKTRVYNGSLISFKALEYNATLDFYWSPLLLESNSDNPIIHRVEYRIIRADRIEKHAAVWRDADVVVFNSYLWWRKQRDGMTMKVMYGSFEDGDARLDEVEMTDAFEVAIRKLTEWLGDNVDRNKTRIFFAGSSPTHSWASTWGGVDSNKCLNETEPIYEAGFKAATTDYSLMAMAAQHFEALEKRTGIHVQVLNITQLSDYRKDGHPSVYRKQYVPLTKEQVENPASYADCTHWCLPGVPDVWNEFLYGYLMKG